ncbi:hypothetical protein OO007_18350 [Cocleimonas sp. KMM 6892]|uniref:hypothetical protein n=1 Tax=unclassified Cocleimonas TaxID=2639732 RepID=UPI002DBEEF4E|nr:MULTISPECIES: hypothetical protein [unclassified Cocleimonas]MEB8434204.1 hypothetical protein [Cocleimonas sp. KMM 6892]MEC4717177.1 hypothetical protein [Cocleimonas sp. KMM 6895]MEC4746476.1 hypothetical protein [Cocleimonas sp. KMM 6896]
MKMKIISSLISVAVLSAVTHPIYAAGTAADTDINNTASISYNVGGTAQTPIESSETGNSIAGVGAGTATTFKVDKKIDLSVTPGSNVNVVPGTSAQSITFTVTNEGNSTENFNLTPSQVTGDIFDTSACSVAAPASLPVSIAADGTASVTVNCDIPASGGVVVNGATSDIDLLAVVDGVTETTVADTADQVDTVFADDIGTATDEAIAGTGAAGNRNAAHSAINTYVVNTADITVKKTSEVTEDPFNGTTNPKRIPGATIEYTIEVTNADGAADAAGLIISDILPVGTGAVGGATASTNGLQFVSCSSTGDATAAVTCSESGGTVTTSAFTLPGGSGSASVQTLTIIATVK